MTTETTVQISATLTSREAEAFAQFLKRSTFKTFRECSDPNIRDEPQLMVDAADSLQRAFSDAGFDPR